MQGKHLSCAILCIMQLLNVPIVQSASKELSLSALLHPTKNISASSTPIYTFSGATAGSINYVQLCLGADNTCSVCNTNFTTTTKGVALAYSTSGTPYTMSSSAIASYLTTQGMSDGIYYIGMYVQSKELNCGATNQYCSTNVDTAGKKLCMQANYVGGKVTDLSQVDNGEAVLNTSVQPAVLTTAGLINNNSNYSGLLVTSTNGGATWDTVNLATQALDKGVLNWITGLNLGGIINFVSVGQNTSKNIPLIYRSANNGATWSAQTPTAETGVFNSVSCFTASASSLTCLSVGQGNNKAIIYRSIDSGATWGSVFSSSNNGRFNAVSCVNPNCIAAGVDTTTNLPLLSVSSDGGATWSQPQTTSGDTGEFYTARCQGSAGQFICLAAGQNNTSKKPLLYYTTSFTSPITWSSPSVSSNTGILESAGCTGTGSTIVCTVVGQDDTTNLPLMYLTTNTGATWSTKNTSVNGGIFYTNACTGNGATAICTAAGAATSATNVPIFYYSQNGGGSWSEKNISNQAGTIYSTRSQGAGNNILAGQYTTKNPLPLLYYLGFFSKPVSPATSNDIGVFNTTVLVSLSPTLFAAAAGQDQVTQLPMIYMSPNTFASWYSSVGSPVFNATACSSGVGSSVICSAVGQDPQSSAPLFYTSNNGGVSWSAVTPSTSAGMFFSTTCPSSNSCIAVGQDKTTNYPLINLSTGINPLSPTDSGVLNAVTCTDSTCVAVGKNQKTNAPLLYTSSDTGTSWSNQVTSNFGFFNSTSCTTSGSINFCTAAGQSTTTSLPILYYSSTPTTAPWTQVSIFSSPGIFNKTSCTTSGSTIICVAVGQDQTTNLPLLYLTKDQGSTWTQPITFTSTGVFYGASCVGTTCVVAGQDNTTGNPMLYYSINTTNNTPTWNRISLTSYQGVFYATKCTQGNNTVTCTASGYNATSNQPLLYLFSNGSWSIVNTGIAGTGIFNGAGGGNGY